MTMKKITLVLVLGLAAAACTFPVRVAETPYSLYGVLPMASASQSTVELGSAPQDFLVTDVVIGSPYARDVVVSADGLPRFCCGAELGASRDDYRSTSQHFTRGILIPAGTKITVSGWAPDKGASITLVGYLR